MKFLVALAAFAVGASAASAAPAATDSTTSECLADYIVTTCLGTEQDKLDACGPTDYDCLCAAKEAVATCYNNCPNDPRAPSAKQEVGIFCANASLYGSKAQAAKTPAAASPTGTSPAAADAVQTTSASVTPAASTSGQTSAKPTATNAAGVVAANGAVLAVAGLVAAML